MLKNELLIEILTEEVPFLEHYTSENTIRTFFKETEILNTKNEYSLNIFSSPTRLVISLSGFEKNITIPEKKVKGPSVNSPSNAIEGFLKKYSVKMNDLTSEDGFFYLISPAKNMEIESILTSKIIPDLFSKISSGYSKTMFWNEARKPWIRPIKNILISLNGATIPFAYSGISSSNKTKVLESFTEIKTFEDLKIVLLKNDIILSGPERLQTIKTGILRIEAEGNLECVAQEKLFQENCYINEFPNTVLGKFDEKYLQLPEKVLILSLEKNQKYFLFRSKKTGKLSNFFAICVNGKFDEKTLENILNGNKRVLSARLEDAIYYIQIDSRFPLKHYIEELKNVDFHKTAGSIYERLIRMQALLEALSSQIKPEIVTDLKEIIWLSKADLQTEMTKSFTELQGYVGSFYAQKEGLKPEICEAIALQYRLGNENVTEVKPSAQAIYFALIEKYEKISTLLEAGETPTSSRDPFGIRKDCLAIIRLLVENEIEINLHFEKDFKEIIIDRLEFYLKNFTKPIVNFVLQKDSTEDKISIFSIYRKIQFLEKVSPELEDYRRVFNILNSNDAIKFKGFTLNASTLSEFELKLFNIFSGDLTIENCISYKILIAEFFEKFMIIDAENEEKSKNRIAILELIAKQISKFISY